MDSTFWVRQTTDQPLFPDMLWSRPEHRSASGKLLIIGGNQYAFAAPAEAYREALNAGIGTAQVLLPDKLRHTVGSLIEAGDFASSTPSGSFSQAALELLVARAAWADGVLLAGDFGRSSETAILLEKFCEAYRGQLTITKDAADYFTRSPGQVLRRPETTLVISFAQLQKIASQAKFSRVFTFSMGLVRLIDNLHEFTATYGVTIVVKHLSNSIVASGGQVSTTKLDSDEEIWRVKTAAYASVWRLQNPGKTLEAVTTAIYEIAQL